MIVLHIGLRKAGSTTIQHFLNDNEEALVGMGIEYPRIGRKMRVDHNNLVNELRERQSFDPKYGSLSELQTFWRSSPSNTLIISGETFEACTHAQCLRLKRILDRGGEEFRIVLVLRDLLDLMISSYAQKIKFGENTYDFDTFYQDRMNMPRVNYARTARIWAKIYGWDSLRIRLLDRQHLLNGDLLEQGSRFLSHQGTSGDVLHHQPSGRPQSEQESQGATASPQEPRGAGLHRARQDTGCQRHTGGRVA